MKKVLIISSSPRKGGNSEKLVQEFERGAKEAGHEVETIYLREHPVAPCIGCYACQKTGHCVQKDEGEAIVRKMLAADVIVFATPVYFYGPSAQIKALIDRSVVVYPTITGKDYYYLMTMAETDVEMFEGTIKGLNGFLDCYEGSTLKGMVKAKGVYERGEIDSTDYPEEAYKLGKSI